jgi:hypothetical protein
VNVRRNSSSLPGSTTWMPSAPVPGLGFARSTASFAISLFVPAPIEIERLVAVRTASRMRCAVARSDSW